jgi:hypothetical protein
MSFIITTTIPLPEHFTWHVLGHVGGIRVTGQIRHTPTKWEITTYGSFTFMDILRVLHLFVISGYSGVLINVLHRKVVGMPYTAYIDCTTSAGLAGIGDFETLKDTYSEDDDDYGDMTCMYAAMGGHLECLQYAHEHGSNINSTTAEWAAARGHLNCLKYLLYFDCDWNTTICAAASANGHLDCLQHAYEAGCPWGADTIYLAVKRGHTECAEYARVNDCPPGCPT